MFRCIHVRICLEHSLNVGYSHTRMFPLFALTDFVLKRKFKKKKSLRKRNDSCRKSTILAPQPLNPYLDKSHRLDNTAKRQSLEQP